ncbi:MAG TPA: Gfo/Idh/MocA family oxidoreductase [Chloroflexota bacterium]|jgi:predicted dehydrogenase
MAQTYTAAIIGCGRMGGSIDDEVRNHPGIIYPYSHAGTYQACQRTTLVAASDVLEDKLQPFCQRWDIPHAYTDFRELIEREQPDIISVTTRPASHREIVVYAAAHGVKAIWCEKPLCCSMVEADSMVDACEQHGVKFNLGVNRRYSSVYRTARRLIAEGIVGDLRTIIGHCAGSALWSHTHASDLFLLLAGDVPVEYVQGTVGADEADYADNQVEVDPAIDSAYIRFAGGIHGYLLAILGYEWEVTGTTGKLRLLNDGQSAELRSQSGAWKQLESVPPPKFARTSNALNCLNDLVAALDSGGATQGNVQLARRSQEIIMGIIASHGQHGARVPLPLANRDLYVGKRDW